MAVAFASNRPTILELHRDPSLQLKNRSGAVFRDVFFLLSSNLEANDVQGEPKNGATDS